MYDPSPSTVKVLADAYWAHGAWRPEVAAGTVTTLPDAVSAGIMFEHACVLDHDGWVAAAKDAAAAVRLEEVSDAFVASLTATRLDLRSALASYILVRRLPSHPFTPTPGSRRCRVCGSWAEPAAQDLNILSFERFMWAGVRRDDLAFAAFDLEMFARAPRVDPDDDAINAGRDLLRSLRSAEPTATVSQLSRSRLLPGRNHDQRRVLLEILGVCGVLRTPGHPSGRTEFIDFADRDLPAAHWLDTAYPACWWRGRDGIDEAAAAELLPRCIPRG